MKFFNRISPVLEKSQIQGWLFYELNSIDPITIKLLDIPKSQVNRRPWFYFAMKEGKNIKICHAIESSTLDHLPGEKFIYYSQKEKENLLKKFSGKIFAANFDYLNHGTALFLEKLGLKLVSSSTLIQKTLGVLSEKQIKSHEEAAAHLYQIVQIAWKKIQDNFKNNVPVYEGEIRDLILNEFSIRNLYTEDGPIVASGPNSGNPHYLPDGKGRQIQPEEVVQFDLWAKGNEEYSVFGDISWVGYTGENPPEKFSNLFSDITKARDSVVSLLSDSLKNNKPLSGSTCDKKAREILIQAGYKDFIKHRTGHGIDTQIHGSGVNLDSIEFPDDRYLENGSCFSIEPGIYQKFFGMRTEIDVYINNGKPVISGGKPQTELLRFNFSRSIHERNC